MMRRRAYHRLSYRDSNFRLCCDTMTAVACAEIVRQRETLEDYIRRQPDFRTSLIPIGLLPDAPEIAQDMGAAAAHVGVGPLAGVAGAIAERAARAALAHGAREAIVENGGDIFAASPQPLLIALHAGPGSPLNGLAFRLDPDDMPRAVCSSSSRMGHSLSLGHSDLATVVAANAALADAAATRLCNMVCKEDDIDPALEYITQVPGIDGALVACGKRVGLLGSLPELVRHADADAPRKITRDRDSATPRH